MPCLSCVAGNVSKTSVAVTRFDQCLQRTFPTDGGTCPDDCSGFFQEASKPKLSEEAVLAIPKHHVDSGSRQPRWVYTLFVGVAAALTGGCATSQSRVALPPVAQAASDVRHPGQFVWHDLVTENPVSARDFYGQLFGWDFEEIQGEGVVYTTIIHDGLAIGGIASIEEADVEVPSSRWLSVLSVEDVDAAVSAVVRGGGSVNMPARDNVTRGRMALVTDPQGAMVVLLRSLNGDPPNLDPDRLVSNRWMWTELWTDDLEASIELYADVVGYESESGALQVSENSRVFMRDGNPRAGLNLLPWPEVRPNWLPYIKVDDAEAVARQVEALGGTILIPPLPEIRNGTTGLMMDPTGAAFAIQEWPVGQ